MKICTFYSLSLCLLFLGCATGENDGSGSQDAGFVRVDAGSDEDRGPDTDLGFDEDLDTGTNDLPQVRFVAPNEDQSFAPGETISVEVEASDDDGISQVELYVDGVLILQDQQAPFAWDSQKDSRLQLSVGLHEILVIATDTAGETGEETVWISVTSTDTDTDPGATEDDKEFQFETTINDANAIFGVFVPGSVQEVEAAFYISGHGQGDITHNVLRQFARDENVALVLFDGDKEAIRLGYYNNVSIMDEHITRLAEEVGHPELPAAPIMTFGHSNGTGFAASWPRDRPEQVIAWTSFHPGFNNYLQYENTELVPALVMCGEEDASYFIRNRQDETVALMRSTRDAAMAIMVEGGVTHGMPDSYETWSFIVEFNKAAMRARLNANGTLKRVDIESGWLGERYDVDTGGRQLLGIASYGAFSAKQSTASWLADQAFAEQWQTYGASALGEWLP